MNYPLFKVHIDKEQALKNLDEVLSSGFFNEGSQVLEFQEKLSDFFSHPNTVALNSCTAAITLALRLSGVNPGDEVITTSMTCVASNMPICNLSAKPVWADIDKNTGNINPKEIAKLITKKTKAVLCVNWAGLPCELEELQDICSNNNIKLIQDAAHSLGALYDNKHICHFADFTCYSFQAIKHATCGDGGALVCKNTDDFEQAKKLKWFGIDREASKNECGEWKGQRWDTDIADTGYKFYMNNIAAAIGLSQVPHLESIIAAHRQNALIYQDQFKENEFVTPLTINKSSNPSHWVYSVLVDPKINRNNVLEKLNKIGIKAATVHIPNHFYSCFKDSFTELPETEYFGNHQLALPCGWWMTEQDVYQVVSEFQKVINEQEPD